VFAGSFELDAAEDVCNGDLAPEDLADLLISLVDKSILIRGESDGKVRFQMLDTLRDFGRGKLREAGEYLQLRRRHMEWCRRLVAEAAADWFSSRQVYWINRIKREMHNLREASNFALSDSPQTLLAMSAGLYLFAIARGFFSEMRHWLDRALAATPSEPSEVRIKALWAATAIAGLQGDVPSATSRAAETRSLAARVADPVLQAVAAIGDGWAALVGGDSDRALAASEGAVGVTDDPLVRVPAMMVQGWALEFQGELGRALIWEEKALAIAESFGEVVFRSFALWSIGVGWWRNGKPERAEELLRQCLQLGHLIDDQRSGAACLEALAWIARARNAPRRAAVLMGAAEALGHRIGISPAVLPDLVVFHGECERRAREVLDTEEFDAAHRQGAAMDFDGAVAYADAGT
jgi:tetratricopeptide (TPR) repeat protein